MPRPAMGPRLAVAGYLSLDTIRCPAGTFGEVVGGGALYAALGAAAAGENLLLSEPSAPGVAPAWEGTVSFVRPLGATVEYEVDLGGREALRVLDLREPHERPFAAGARVAVMLRNLEACIVLPAEAGP